MKRKFLLNQLYKYETDYPFEDNAKEEIIEFVESDPRCFEKINFKGHVTGSCIVATEDLSSVLLNHHRKINKWLQFGGHSDGHNNPFEVAWREAQEESGLTTLRYMEGYEGIFDLDVHTIASYGEAPEHKHFDVRILLIADKEEDIKLSSESLEIKWVNLDKVKSYNSNPAFIRMIDKIRKIKIGK